MFERISRSFDLARSSWHVLRTDKKLVLFPIFSCIGVLIVLASFLVPSAGPARRRAAQDGSARRKQPRSAWSGGSIRSTFAFYFCNYFVIVFCNSALTSCALMRFDGQESTIGDGFRKRRAPVPGRKICRLGAQSSATVGLLP